MNQFLNKLDFENKCNICGLTTGVHPRCINCNVRICINHWNKHKEVHMKDISPFQNTIPDCLDFKTCIKYMLFKKL